MKAYGANEIRNVLLVGHAGAGKTSLLEAMLFTSGSITRMGVVEEGNTVSDHDPDEQRRGISVSLAMAPVEWRDTKINTHRIDWKEEVPGWSVSRFGPLLSMLAFLWIRQKAPRAIPGAGQRA